MEIPTPDILSQGLFTSGSSRAVIATSFTKVGHRNWPKNVKIVKTYWHDHSLESSWGALSDGTVNISIKSFKKTSS
jgi:hypothetical protein